MELQGTLKNEDFRSRARREEVKKRSILPVCEAFLTDEQHSHRAKGPFFKVPYRTKFFIDPSSCWIIDSFQLSDVRCQQKLLVLRHFVWNLIGFQCAVAYHLVIPAEAGIQ